MRMVTQRSHIWIFLKNENCDKTMAHVNILAQFQARSYHDDMRQSLNKLQFGESSESSEGDNDSESVAQEDEDMSDAEEDCVQLDFGVEPQNVLVHT